MRSNRAGANLLHGTGVNPCTIETRGGAESFLRFLQKRFGF
jgi:hypothetical protein